MKQVKLTLLLALPLALHSCRSAQVMSGKAIYCPGVQLEKLPSTKDSASDRNWHAAQEESYVSLTNLQNGKKIKTQILMRKTTETGSVIVSVNKDAAEALGIMHTGLAPVEIRYSRRTL